MFLLLLGSTKKMIWNISQLLILDLSVDNDLFTALDKLQNPLKFVGRLHPCLCQNVDCLREKILSYERPSSAIDFANASVYRCRYQ
jgi:hypothetical protein